MEDKDKIKVIVADDNLVFLEGLNLLFSKRDEFKILDTCANGKELINNKHIGRADLLLIDIEMPEMNGFEAAKYINHHYSKLPMIAITMYMDTVYMNDIMGSGFKAFIHKPEVSEKLFDTIASVLNNKRVFPKNIKLSKN